MDCGRHYPCGSVHLFQKARSVSEAVTETTTTTKEIVPSQSRPNANANANANHHYRVEEEDDIGTEWWSPARSVEELCLVVMIDSTFAFCVHVYT